MEHCLNPKSLAMAFLLFGVLTSSIVSAQNSLKFEAVEARYNEGLELFYHSGFANAQSLFDKIEQDLKGQQITQEINRLLEDSRYHASLCAVYLKHEDAPQRLNGFISKHPGSPRVDQVRYELGMYYYSDKQYRLAIKWLQLADSYKLSQEDRSARSFYLGYAYLKEDQKQAALSTFRQIADKNDDNANAANYYIGYLSYDLGQYDEAITAFKRIENTRKYSKVVPLHISQIYYQQKDYDKLIAYAEPMVENPHVRDRHELERLLGQTYFEKKEYPKALPFLEGFTRRGKNLRPDDYYMTGFCAYQAGEFEKAINSFKRVANEEAALGQNASYYMADCHLKLGEKREARNAFRSASKLDYDNEISELAAFNYSKLSYELNYHQEALRSLQDFIREYPNSKYGREATEVLGDVLLSSKNYAEALKILETIEPKTEQLRKTQQKVSFLRAAEYYAQRKYNEAVNLFNYAIDNDIDKSIEARALFWKAEALYQMKNFDGCRFIHGKFLDAYNSQLDLLPEENPLMANYTTAYAYKSTNNIKMAASSFKRAVDYYPKLSMAQKSSAKNTSSRDDAVLRLADSYFSLNQYSSAVKYYDQALASGSPGADYALFQKAVVQGLLKRNTEKVSTFAQLIRKYPRSEYVDDALLQMGIYYFLKEDYTDARDKLETLVKDYPNSVLVPRAKNTIGLIFYNESDYQNALKVYKEVAETYPRLQEGRDALLGIRDIYIALNDVDGYVAYVERNKDKFGEVDLDKRKQDELSWQATEKIALEGNCQKSIPQFDKYLARYPRGLYSVDAHYMRGDCHYANGADQKALTDFKYVADEARNAYTERALTKLCRILYEAGDRSSALGYYKQLSKIAESQANKEEAYLGIMRCAYAEGDLSETESAAKSLQQGSAYSSAAKREARLYLGNIALNKNALIQALGHFEEVIKGPKDLLAAQALYGKALVQYRNGDYDESQKTIFKLVDEVPYYDYWLAKSFILLSDTYVQQNNLFQARATLESVLDNHTGEELRALAKKKLAEIDKLEQNNG